MKTVAQVLTGVIVAPIWYYLLYKILVAVNATELMWFLFWVYLPVGMFAKVMLEIATRKEGK